MQVTWLPDARPRPRHVAVGEFDGVHVGHREVIRGADTVLTFEPHPRTVVAPDSAPKLLTSLAVKADLVAELGVAELVVIPFDGTFAAQSAQEFIDQRAGRAARRADGLGRGELPLRPPRQGRRRAAARPGRVRDARRATLVEVDGEIVSSTHIRGLVIAGRGRRRAALPRRAVPDARRRRARRQARAHARLPDREPRARRRARGARATASTPAARSCRRRGAPGRRVNVGVRPTFKTGRGLLVEAYLLDFDGDLYGQRAAARLPRAPARRAALRQRRGAGRADAPRRGGCAPDRRTDRVAKLDIRLIPVHGRSGVVGAS